MLNTTNYQENANKITISYHSTCVRMAVIKTRDRFWKGCRKETFVDCLWQFNLVQPLWKLVWRFLKNFKMDLPHGPSNSKSGCSKQMKTPTQKDRCTTTFTVALFTTAKISKQPVFISGWATKENVYVYNGYYPAIRKRMKCRYLHNMDRPWGHCAVK